MTDGRTDGRKDGQTDEVSNRGATLIKRPLMFVVMDNFSMFSIILMIHNVL